MRLLLERGDFWRGHLDGLAVFSAPDYLRAFKLPVAFDELVVTGESAHVTPLLKAVGDEAFYILAISQGSVRLVRASRYGSEEIDLSSVDMPRSLDEAMRYDDFEKTNLQRHPTQRRSDTGGRTLQHGHGPGDADLKNEILRYFQAVDSGLSKLLAGESAPLVVAAVDYLIPLFRQANNYPALVEKGIEGNPELLSPDQLHERARPIVEPLLRTSVIRLNERFGNALGTGLASCDLAVVLGAAYGNRVESLLVCDKERRWGIFDLTSESLELHDEPQGADVELIDLAVRQTVLHGGTVYVVEREQMPCEDPVAAVFRF
jgi:Bacterial archaeo-eukaryotic release factor family 7